MYPLATILASLNVGTLCLTNHMLHSYTQFSYIHLSTYTEYVFRDLISCIFTLTELISLCTGSHSYTHVLPVVNSFSFLNIIFNLVRKVKGNLFHSQPS